LTTGSLGPAMAGVSQVLDLIPPAAGRIEFPFERKRSTSTAAPRPSRILEEQKRRGEVSEKRPRGVRQGRGLTPKRWATALVERLRRQRHPRRWCCTSAEIKSERGSVTWLWASKTKRKKDGRTNIKRGFDIASAVDSYLERLNELLLGSEEPESEEDKVGREELLGSDL
jgi:hypothetical protein